jgi:hypothetical protein
MPEVNPGSHKYRHSESIPRELGSDAARRGDALAVGASGAAVQTTGSNGCLGVLSTATAADADADVDIESDISSGDGVAVAVQGVVRAKVADFGSSAGSVQAGDALTAGANGALTNADSGDGSAAKAGVNETKAIEDADADGFALVLLR